MISLKKVASEQSPEGRDEAMYILYLGEDVLNQEENNDNS